MILINLHLLNNPDILKTLFKSQFGILDDSFNDEHPTNNPDTSLISLIPFLIIK